MTEELQIGTRLYWQPQIYTSYTKFSDWNGQVWYEGKGGGKPRINLGLLKEHPRDVLAKIYSKYDIYCYKDIMAPLHKNKERGFTITEETYRNGHYAPGSVHNLALDKIYKEDPDTLVATPRKKSNMKRVLKRKIEDFRHNIRHSIMDATLEDVFKETFSLYDAGFKGGYGVHGEELTQILKNRLTNAFDYCFIDSPLKEHAQLVSHKKDEWGYKRKTGRVIEINYWNIFVDCNLAAMNELQEEIKRMRNLNPRLGGYRDCSSSRDETKYNFKKAQDFADIAYGANMIKKPTLDELISSFKLKSNV